MRRDRTAENFTRPLASSDDRVVRTLPLLVLATALLGCGAPASRLPPGALLERARAGREPEPTPRALAVVAFADAQVGKSYCWGGKGPSCFDCSGLANTAWFYGGGAEIPRTSGDIAERLPEVPLEEVRAGDILWWPGHVGIYAGNGWMIDARGRRYGVVRRPAHNPHRAFRPPTDDPG
jgi:cell wall-associated NlpC family hydrolase